MHRDPVGIAQSSAKLLLDFSLVCNLGEGNHSGEETQKKPALTLLHKSGTF